MNPGLVYLPRSDTLILPKFALPHVTGTPWYMHRGLALISLNAVITLNTLAPEVTHRELSYITPCFLSTESLD